MESVYTEKIDETAAAYARMQAMFAETDAAMAKTKATIN